MRPAYFDPFLNLHLTLTLTPAHLGVVGGAQVAHGVPQRPGLRLVLGELGQRGGVLRAHRLHGARLLRDRALARLPLQLALRRRVGQWSPSLPFTYKTCKPQCTACRCSDAA